MGDFNAEPDEPTYARMRDAGFRSAHLEANGAEPAVTWPSGLQAPGIDTDGPPGCLDYIWVRGAIARRFVPARLRPAGGRRSGPYPSRPSRALGPHLGSTEASGRRGALRLAHRGDWRRGPENTLAGLPGRARGPRLRRARVRCPGCRVMAWPCATTMTL